MILNNTAFHMNCVRTSQVARSARLSTETVHLGALIL